MPANINRVVLEGNLTRDPELRQANSGTSIANLRIAVNDRLKRGEQWEDAAYYFDVVVFGRQAESCGQYLQRGSGVIVDGKLTWREYEAKDGSGKRQAIEVRADNIRFTSRAGGGGGGGFGGGGGGGSYGGGGGGGGSTYVPPATREPDFGGAGPDDDIPF